MQTIVLAKGDTPIAGRSNSAKPGSRPYCSAMPTQTLLGDFEGSNYKLPKQVWDKYDWSISHCVLRSDNSPIALG